MPVIVRDIMSTKQPNWMHYRYCKADELLQSLGMSSLPIDVIKIANILDVPVFVGEDMQEDGVLYMDIQQQLARIYVKKGAPSNRSRFTIAHELGHLMMHDFDGVIHRDTANQEQNIKEREANSFAARLLIPTEQLLIYKHLAGGAFAEENVPELAHIFRVSQDAMYYRIKNMRWFA